MESEETVNLQSEAPAPWVALKAPEERRALRPGQAGIAWQKLRRVIWDYCRKFPPKPLGYRAYGNTIEFRSKPGGPVVTLIHHQEDQVSKRMNGTEETIRIVRLKLQGVGTGFLLRGQLYSAPRLLIEILCETRQFIEAAAAPKLPPSSGTGKKKRRRGAEA